MLSDKQLQGLSSDRLKELRRKINTILTDRRVGRAHEPSPNPGYTSRIVGGYQYEDGRMQQEMRVRITEDGTVHETGPYWLFWFHEDGKQKRIYLGKTPDPEGKLEEKRGG